MHDIYYICKNIITTTIMKRRFGILVALLVLSFSTVSAKGLVSYQGEVDLGYSYGLGKNASERVILHTIQGIKIGKYLSTGIGAGFDFYYAFDDSSEMIVPIYINIKGYLPTNKNISPYLSCDVGMGVGVTGDVDDKTGLTVSPAVGFVWGVFKAQIGYSLQNVKKLEFGDLSMGSVQLRIGIMF